MIDAQDAARYFPESRGLAPTCAATLCLPRTCGFDAESLNPAAAASCSRLRPASFAGGIAEDCSCPRSARKPRSAGRQKRYVRVLDRGTGNPRIA
jgi:hypothetical protein